MIKNTFVKNKKGFTLIELLVVISIIGLLSSIVLASLNTTRVKAADTAIKADLKGIATSAEIEYATLGYKYNTTGVAVTSSSCSTLLPAVTTGTILQNPKIQDAMKHILANNGGKEITCSIPADGKSYTISAPLRTTPNLASVDSTSGNLNAGSLVVPSNFNVVIYPTNGITWSFIDTVNVPATSITYELERSTNANGPFTVIDSRTVSVLGGTYNYSGSATGGYSPSTTYYFRMRVIKGTLYSAYSSNQVYVTMP